MNDKFSRISMIIGSAKLESLKNIKIAVFGIGGVGGYVVEALTRSGIGQIDIIDNDVVSISNLNRQIISLKSTIGKSKVEVMKERMMEINEDIVVNCYQYFLLKNEDNYFDFSQYDYIIDAVDTVTAKITIIEEAYKHNIPVISCMGTGNKLDPSKLIVTDINKTTVCPLARVIRYELRKRGIKKLKVVYSTEEPVILEKEFKIYFNNDLFNRFIKFEKDFETMYNEYEVM